MAEGRGITVDDLDPAVDDELVTLLRSHRDAFKIEYHAELEGSWAARVEAYEVGDEYRVDGALAHFDDKYARDIYTETASLVDVVHELSYVLYVQPEALVVDEAAGLVGDTIPTAALCNEGDT